MPDPPGLFSIFKVDSHTPPEKFWFRLDAQNPLRTELVVRTRQAYETSDLTTLDNWIQSSDLKFSQSQAMVMDAVRSDLMLLSKRYDEVYEAQLATLAESQELGSIEQIISIVGFDRNVDGNLHKDPRWTKYTDGLADSNDERAQILCSHALFLQGKKTDAVALIRKHHGERRRLSENWANHYLWQILVLGASQEELQDAYDWVIAKRPRDGREQAAYLHTLVCVDALLDRPADAIKYFEAPIGKLDSDSLVRALILECLQFPQPAQKLYQSIIAAAEHGDCAAIAKHRLRAIAGNTLRDEGAK